MSFVHAQQKVMHTIYSPKYYRNIIIIQSRLFDNSVRKYNKMTSVVLNGSEKSNVGENDYHWDIMEHWRWELFWYYIDYLKVFLELKHLLVSVTWQNYSSSLIFRKCLNGGHLPLHLRVTNPQCRVVNHILNSLRVTPYPTFRKSLLPEQMSEIIIQNIIFSLATKI